MNLIRERKSSIIYSLLLVFLLIPFFKPDIVTSFQKINYIYIVVMGISFLCVLCIYIKNMKINKFDILCLMFYAILAISTFKNKGNILKLVSDFILNFGIVVFVNIYKKGNKVQFLKVISIFYYVLLILNTISFLIFPEGIAQTEYLKTPIYLIGIDNRFAFTYIPGLCIIAIYDILVNKKLTKYTYIFFIATYATFIYFWSAGALIAESLFLVFYIVIYKLKIKNLIGKYFPTVIISFVLLVICRLQRLFKYLIVDILHKDLTLSSRTLLWDSAIKIIKENKLIGIGVQKSKRMIELISAYHSHSHFLNVILQSGFLGISVYFGMIFSVFAKLKKYKENIIAQIIAFTLFVIFIMLLVDTFDITCNLMLLMTLGYNIAYFVEEK